MFKAKIHRVRKDGSKQLITAFERVTRERAIDDAFVRANRGEIVTVTDAGGNVIVSKTV